MDFKGAGCINIYKFLYEIQQKNITPPKKQNGRMNSN